MLKIFFVDDLVIVGSSVTKNITKEGQNINVLKFPTNDKINRVIDNKFKKILEILLVHKKYTRTPEKNNRAHSINRPS